MPSVRSLLLASIGMLTLPATAADISVRQPAYALPPPVEAKRFYLHLGPVGLIYSESAKMSAGGFGIPGADVRIPNSLSFAFEVGYHLTPNFAIGFAGGFPPLAKVEARGSLTGLGTLGKTQGGPIALTAQYHFTGMGAFQPYVGVGPAAMIIFGSKDGLVQDLKVEHALGVTGQIGFNYMINESWGAFVDVKKVFLKTRTTGSMGGVPIRGTVTLDPLVVHTGLTYRF